MSDDLADRVKRLEYGLWGLNGNGGVAAKVENLQREIHDWREEETARRKEDQARRAQQAEAARVEAIAVRRERVRNRLTLAGIVITGIAAMTTAVLTVVQL